MFSLAFDHLNAAARHLAHIAALKDELARADDKAVR